MIGRCSTCEQLRDLGPKGLCVDCDPDVGPDDPLIIPCGGTPGGSP